MAISNYKTPGVTIKEIDAFPLSVVGVNTAIPVFVGTTQKPADDAQGNTINGPVLINTLAEYIERFGLAEAQPFTVEISESKNQNEVPVPDHYDINKVKDDTSTKDTKTDLYYQMQMFYANGGSTCYVYSTEDKTWEKINGSLATKDDITIVVLPETFKSSYGAAINKCAALNRIVLLSSPYKADMSGFRGDVGSENLKHAAAYTPYLNTSLGYVIDPGQINVSADPAITTLGLETTKPLSEFKTKQTQLYNQILAAVTAFKVNDLPPTGAMAGVYAKTDRDRGVWMAPANVALNSVIKPSEDITAFEQESLNVDPSTGKSINAIRYFPGKGTLVWGARTLDGNSNDWRYISVRRTVSYVEQSLEFALQNYVFESNNAMTWLKVSTMIDTFLNELWQQGGLVGSSANDAYFVNLGLGSTMTPQDILAGRMIINIGLAMVRPAEFIELSVTQLLQK